MRAEPADQALRHHAFDRAGDQERLDAHVDQPRVGAGGVVGVQRAEHQVAGERGLNGVLGRFQIADFADQHDVRVVPQDAAQRVAERQADLGVHLNLVDPFELILDRVFGGDDLRRLASLISIRAL